MKNFRIGICHLNNWGPGGATKRLMALAEHFAQHFSVTLITNQSVDWQQRQRFFGVDLSQVNYVYLRPLRQSFQQLSWLPSPWHRRFCQIATLRHSIRQIRALQLDLFINSSPDMTLPPLAKRGIYMCTFPWLTPSSKINVTHFSLGRRMAIKVKNWLKWAFYNSVYNSVSNNVLADYDVITANSRFTQSWIQKKWGLPSTVVYSACELIDSTQPKEKIICHAGRFVADSGVKSVSKRQDILIESFKALPDLHQAGWQLHLAGGLLHNNVPNEQYLAQLKCAAQGYPIFFHENAPLDDLHDLYRRASIYWHATGYGQDAQRYPELQEHFGMTTVEAMSAGAVPVVINSGGQAEIVTHGVNGFVWEQVADLAASTRRLVNDQPLRGTLSRQAVAHSQTFGKANFLARMDAILEQCL